MSGGMLVLKKHNNNVESNARVQSCPMYHTVGVNIKFPYRLKKPLSYGVPMFLKP